MDEQRLRLMKVNKYTLIVVDVICMSMFFGSTFDYFKGTGTVLTSVVVSACALIQSTMCGVLYFKKKDTNALKYVASVGFTIVYLLTVALNTSDLIFVIAFPVSIIFILYYDYKLIVRFSLALGLINVADILYITLVLKQMPSGNPIDDTSIMIRVLCMLLYCVFYCTVTRVSNEINDARIASMNEAKQKSDEMLEDIITIAKSVKENSTNAEGRIGELVEYVNSTADELGGISEANTSNTENISSQTEMTNTIQGMIKETKDMSDAILEMAERSLDSVREGEESIKGLQQQAKRTEEANEEIVKSVSSLIENADLVANMTSQISAISGQTNLLALNAAIESARAGESGRGFAVVADEIGKLADETKQLTDKIQDIVEGLQQNAGIAKEKLEMVIENSTNEFEIISAVEGGFTKIGNDMGNLGENIEEIHTKIDEIMEANEGIVDSINSISAVSEQVNASTHQAVELGGETRNKANEVKDMMAQLIEVVAKVDKHIEQG